MLGEDLASKINVKAPMTLASVRSMAVVLLLFIHCLFVDPVGCGGFVLRGRVLLCSTV